MVKYSKINMANLGEEDHIVTPIWSSICEPDAGDSQPVIAYSPSGAPYDVHLAWAHFDGETKKTFRHTKFDINMSSMEQESTINEISGGSFVSYSSPSIGFYDVNTLGATVREGSTKIRKLYYNGTSWNMESEYLWGLNATLSTSNCNLLYTDFSQNPLFKITQPEEEGEKADNNFIVETEYRKAHVNLSRLPGLNMDGEASIAFGDIVTKDELGYHKWPFLTGTDSLTFDNFHSTQPLYISSEIDSLKFKFKIKIWELEAASGLPYMPFVRLDLIDSQTQ